MVKLLTFSGLTGIALLVGFLFSLEHKSQDLQSQPWQSLIGKPAPEWKVEDWVNSQPITRDDLKGKVVLIRWWLESCPYCQATAPTLNEFSETYGDKGLVVIGMYHEKPRGRKVTSEEIKHFSAAKGFNFPIANDHQWRTLQKFWPADIPMDFTSVSFLLDQQGIIRYIHPGGSYNADAQPFNNAEWQKDYCEIKAQIEELLKQ